MRMFFITGTGRSGTNLLRNMLRTHPDIEVMLETHFYPVLIEFFGNDSVLFSDLMGVVQEHCNSEGRAWIDIIVSNEGVDTEKFWALIEAERQANASRSISEHMKVITDGIYGEGKIIGDKTPNSGIYASELLEIFPEAKFIHARRDGVFSALSMMKHPGFVKAINGLENAEKLDRAHYRGCHVSFPDTPVSIEQAIDFWKKLATGLMRGLGAVPQDRVLEFAYEDLLREPGPVLDRIAGFLGVSPDRAWAYEASRLVRPLALKQMAWKVSKEEYERLFARLADTAIEYGYRVEDYETYRNHRVPVSEWSRYLLGRILAYGEKIGRQAVRRRHAGEIAGSQR